LSPLSAAQKKQDRSPVISTIHSTQPTKIEETPKTTSPTAQPCLSQPPLPSPKPAHGTPKPAPTQLRNPWKTSPKTGPAPSTLTGMPTTTLSTKPIAKSTETGNFSIADP